MNPIVTFCLMACLLAATVSGVPNQKHQSQGRDNASSQKMKPSQWLSASELESVPAVNEMTLEKLESMPTDKGAELIEKIYHLAQINNDLRPKFVPSSSNIAVTILKPNGQKIQTQLNQLVATAKNQHNFGDEEVTIFITGLPQTTRTVRKATRKLVQAYMQRYNLQQQQQNAHSNRNKDDDNSSNDRTSSEEDYNESWKSASNNNGDLVIIDLGSALTDFERFATLDVEQTGAKIGDVIVQMTNKLDVPNEIIHIVAQGIASHVAGAAGNEYTRVTGRKLRRITALDPSKQLAKNRNVLTSLSRGDADFVDAIHTSCYGMGSPNRVGNVDFYVNGLSAGVPGADNVVESSMRATRYFAESVRPGNERNFPAVQANSLKQYKSNNGIGQRAYMGIQTDYDLQGDYILEVNANSPFGKKAPAQKQGTYHGAHHESWSN